MSQELNQYEADTFSIKFLIKIISAFIVILLAIYVIGYGIYREMTGIWDRASYYNDGTDIALKELRSYESNQLSSYGYINQDEKIYRIPIQKAIDNLIKSKKY